ncbi:MAG TPA: hypothetical protein VEY89_13610 [Candidatus Dormibacteraeota bacterium]|nr:hypothetical protein [Candidatus Dormibacteraeota bacterium]
MGTIQPARVLGRVHLGTGAMRPVRSIVLRREIWRSDAGSTDTVYVDVDPRSRLSILGVHNWVGRESRVASGGRGSLARSGPVVPSAASPLRNWANETLLPAVSEAVSELTDILHSELGVPLEFECKQIGTRPRGR